MKVLEIAGKALDVVKLARNLQGATASRVTRTQAGATFAVCLVVAGLAMIPGSPLADLSVAIAAVTFLVPTLGPLLSRAFGKKEKSAELTVPEFLDDLAALLEAKEARAERREVDAERLAEHKDDLLAMYRAARARMLDDKARAAGGNV